MSPPHDPLVVAQAERRLLNAERRLDDIVEHDVADLDQAMDELYAAERSLAKAR